jgi:hypothetical protein
MHASPCMAMNATIFFRSTRRVFFLDQRDQFVGASATGHPVIRRAAQPALCEIRYERDTATPAAVRALGQAAINQRPHPGGGGAPRGSRQRPAFSDGQDTATAQKHRRAWGRGRLCFFESVRSRGPAASGCELSDLDTTGRATHACIGWARRGVSCGALSVASVVGRHETDQGRRTKDRVGWLDLALLCSCSPDTVFSARRTATPFRVHVLRSLAR